MHRFNRFVLGMQNPVLMDFFAVVMRKRPGAGSANYRSIQWLRAPLLVDGAASHGETSHRLNGAQSTSAHGCSHHTHTCSRHADGQPAAHRSLRKPRVRRSARRSTRRGTCIPNRHARSLGGRTGWCSQRIPYPPGCTQTQSSAPAAGGIRT